MMQRPITTAGAPSPRFRPKDAVLLAVLGATHLGHGSFREITEAVRRVAKHDWQPTGDVILACVREAMEAGLIRRIRESGQARSCRLEITEAGALRLRDILCSPAPVTGGFGRVCSALKICFLGALLPDARGRCVEDLRHQYESELAELRGGCRGCPRRDGLIQLWMDHEISRLEWEVAWLDDFRLEAGQETSFG